jgi:hypothetical protein
MVSTRFSWDRLTGAPGRSLIKTLPRGLGQPGTTGLAEPLSRRAHRLVIANLVIAATFITGLAIWDLAGTLPLPLGVLGHEGSTVIVGLNGLRLLSAGVWRRALRGGDTR